MESFKFFNLLSKYFLNLNEYHPIFCFFLSAELIFILVIEIYVCVLLTDRYQFIL